MSQDQVSALKHEVTRLREKNRELTKVIEGNLTTIDGNNFSVKVYHGNRFGHITVYETNCEYGKEFPYIKDQATALESAKSPSEIDDLIMQFYANKKGRKAL